jgi:hypothetical protein
MITDPLVQKLIDAGFTDGWALADGVLIVWEHKEEPPSPLVRPSEAPTITINSAD